MTILHDALLNALQSDLSQWLSEDSTQGFASRVISETLLKKCIDLRTDECARLALNGFESRHTKQVPSSYPRLSQARIFCQQVLGPLFEDSELMDGLRPGPGSNINLYDGSTSPFLKLGFGNPSVSDEDVYLEYRLLTRKHDPVLYEAESLRFREFGSPVRTAWSRVTTVPKTSRIDRVIAVEPHINSYLQQGVKHCVERRLSRVGLDIATQASVNQRLAKKGSLDGSLATIDFSAASDSLTWTLLEALLPESWTSYIRFVSTPAVKLRGEIKEGSIALTMGNAITFPLETLVFLALVRQVYHDLNLPFVIGKNVSVFGDDVILVTEAAQRFIELAAECGFVVNTTKSFLSGEFRESCGADWLLGRNVRGVYLKTVRKLQNLLAGINLLEAWSYRHDLPLKETVNVLSQEIQSHDSKELLVPLGCGLDSGRRTFLGTGTWSKRYQCYKVRCRQWKHDKRVAIPHFSFQWKLAVAASSKGWLADGFLLERPRCSARSVHRDHLFYEWTTPHENEFWLYDRTLGSSGFIDDPDEAWRRLCLGAAPMIA